MNSFLPADLKVVGPQVDRPRLQDYLQEALVCAEALGTKVIVFGSGGARMAPNGFSRERVRGQLQELLTMAGDEIERNHYGMAIGIEPLRKAECNIVNSAYEAYERAVRTSHPRIRIMVDFFHLAIEGEDPATLLRAKDYSHPPSLLGSGSRPSVPPSRIRDLGIQSLPCQSSRDRLSGTSESGGLH